ncbi:MAG: Bax inhibitor-1/YccA family protein [Planctomycetota bacterium]
MLGGNPTLNTFGGDEPARWDQIQTGEIPPPEKVMTLQGTIIASGALLAICIGAALIAWLKIVEPAVSVDGKTLNYGALMPWLFGSMIGGLVLSLVCIFAKKTCMFLGPLYAAAEGIFIATVSAVIVHRFMGEQNMGLIFQAVTLTFGIFGGLLIAYGSGLIRTSPIINKVFMVGMGGIMLYVAALWIGNGIFGLGIPNLYSSASPLGIGFSLFVVAMASYSLVIDFETIKQGVAQRAPKHYEWFAAVGLLISLVWLYIEVLRLVAKLRSSE